MSGPWLQRGAPAGVQPGSRSEAMDEYDAEPKTRQQQTREEDLVAQVGLRQGGVWVLDTGSSASMGKYQEGCMKTRDGA